MASGETLVPISVLSNEPPGSIAALPDRRNFHAVLDFDDTVDEEAVFTAIMPRSYGGGGVTIYIHYSMETAIANEVVWQTAFERVGDGVQDVDADGFEAFQTSGAITVPGTSGNVDITTTTHTDGTQMDNIAVGEKFRLKIRRDADDTSATDDATGNAELHAIEIKET